MVTGSTSVSLQQGGLVVKAAMPDSNGKFLLQPVAPGSYTLILAAPGRTTAIITNVAVVADTVTSVNASGTPLNPPASASGTVNGTAPVDTLVRVLQPLTAGPTLEVAGRFVDGATGNYSYPLVVNAPLVAPYMAAPGSLVFVADTAAAGKYVLNASLNGVVKTMALATLTAGATITTPFMFP